MDLRSIKIVSKYQYLTLIIRLMFLQLVDVEAAGKRGGDRWRSLETPETRAGG